MAEKLCTLRTKGGGGGKQTETVLWTNPSPSSNFSSQDVTLSDNISNYDYIGIVTAFNTSGGNRSKTLMSVSDFKNSPFPQTGNQVTLNMGSATSSITMYRVAYYSSDTTVRIGTAVSSAGNTNNAYVIPTQIVGIKNIGGTSIKSQFKEIFICSSPGSASDALASRGYELENAQSGDTLTGDAYNTTYLTATYTSGSTGYCTVTAKSDITAMVLKGYNTATYTVQNYTTGQVVGTCNRKSGDFLIIGIL